MGDQIFNRVGRIGVPNEGEPQSVLCANREGHQIALPILGWERSRLSHQIARMEARGTVERAACDDDARGFDVVLTDVGLAAIEEAAPAHLEEVRHCFVDVLTPEQLDTLGDIADVVMTHLVEEHGVGGNGQRP
ncbi:MAG: MarR family winged helix-turn-helix transcriptional regulator [Acidimicrobiales bacterium]